ncbi:MAG: hypothetical protein ABR886_11665 [Dehalococcoidales bacterium]|jgi:hypothetical protein
MTMKNALEPGVITAEPLHETTGYCPVCHTMALFTVDKGMGYLKQCPKCGNLEYLRPRTLRFNRKSRQWQ